MVLLTSREVEQRLANGEDPGELAKLKWVLIRAHVIENNIKRLCEIRHPIIGTCALCQVYNKAPEDECPGCILSDFGNPCLGPDSVFRRFSNAEGDDLVPAIDAMITVIDNAIGFNKLHSQCLESAAHEV